MELHQSQVAIKLHMRIEDNGQTEQTTTKAAGLFYNKKNFDVLTFDERLDENLKVKNLITIQPDKVSIKRSGAITMHQQFHINQATENIYRHPHGNFHMETFTNKINYQPELTPGKLVITYTVKLNGQEERKHELTLSVEKENSQ